MSRPAVFSSRSYAEALAASNDSGKLLVLDATASWCQPCKVMDQVTWADAGVITWLGQHAIAIQIDVDEEKDLASALRIRAMPTVVAFRAGSEVDRVVGLKKPGELISWLEAVQRGETSVDQHRKAVLANPADMRARYSLARSLAISGRFDEATSAYEWLWQHVLEYEPSMVGVRGSFMLSEVGNLIAEHPPARARFAHLRDALGATGPAAAATTQEVGDWLSLSLLLGEAERVLAWFDGNAGLLDTRPELAHVVRRGLVPVLIDRGRWADISKLFRDPLAVVGQSYRRLDDVKKQEMPAEMTAMLPHMIAAIEGAAREEAALIVASLLAAGRESEARSVLEEVRRRSPGADTERALLEKTKKAGVSLP